MHSIDAAHPQQTIRQWWFVPFLIGALLVFTWARFSNWPSPIVERDLYQHRSNVPAPLPNGELSLSQSFIPQKNGLSEVEVWLIRYGEPQPDSTGQLIFTVRDEAGSLIAEERRRVAAHKHSDAITISFLPQADSAEKTYTLTITGIDNSAFSVSAYTLDALDGAFSLSTGETSEIQDLRLTTRYTLTPIHAIQLLGKQLRDNFLLFSVTLLFILLPSALIFSFLPPLTRNNSTHIAILIALGMSVWPLIWTWTSLVNFAWTGPALWAVMIIGWLGVLVQLVRRYREKPFDLFSNVPSNHSLALFSLLLFCLLLRLLAARGLEFPPWVDSVRHLIITNIMADTGQVLQGYRPYFDVGPQLYHFGFHTLSASIDLLLNRNASETLLMLGQLINTLVLLGIYAAGYLLTRRRGVGLLAAFIVGLPMFFPAYYMSWGRLTQLAGMLILGVLIGLTWRLAREKISAEIPHILIVALLTGGLFLIHFRIFLLYLPFALLAWVFGRPKRGLPIAGIITFAITLPRIIQFARITRPAGLLKSAPSYNDFPTGYITVGWETPFLILAIACVVLALLHLTYEYQSLNWIVGLGFLCATLAGEWLGFIPILFDIPFLRTGLVAGFFAFVLGGWQQPIGNWPLLLVAWLSLGHWLQTAQEQGIAIVGVGFLLWITPKLQTRRWRKLIFLNALWVASLFLLLLGKRVGLPESWVLNLNSMIISLFLPYSITIAIVVWALWGWFQQRHWIVLTVLFAGVGGLVMYTTLFSVPHQINILNQETVLVKSADLPALAWLDDNLPQDAHIAVNSWRWLNQAWSGYDGGTLIVPLLQRSSTMPPPDYTYNRELRAEVNEFNIAADAVEDWSTAEASQFLRENGVTHVYIGARGGFFKPEQLTNNLDFELLYAKQGTFIFALR
ncbi:MAG: hypothetical protein ACPG8W_13855 [Candidatus Promineifilaceae bacterium]